MTKPLFSVIVPLEYHRGQWEQCWLGWQTQTVPKNQYETILVVPPDFLERDKLPALLGPQDRLEYSNEHHDIGLCAIGAARAHGNPASAPRSRAMLRHLSTTSDWLASSGSAALRHRRSWIGMSSRRRMPASIRSKHTGKPDSGGPNRRP